jgi:hypothetical protein
MPLVRSVMIDAIELADNYTPPVPAPPTVTVTWTMEPSTVPIDYYELTLRLLAGESRKQDLVKVITTEPSAQIDSQLFQPMNAYVFEIRAISGAPNTGTGDFVTPVEPFLRSTSFSDDFVVP